MKTTKKFDELELMRRGCTPAQFAAYVRQMLKKHGIDYIDIDFDYWKRGGDLEFNYHDDPDRPCKAERSISKPYEMQTYIRNWDGSVYNLIMEFDHWDEKTGFGYFYFINTIDATEETTDTENTTDTAENEEGDAPMNNTITASTIIDMVDHLVSIRKNATRSAWNRGLTAYAAELTEGLREAVEGGYFDPDDLNAPRLVERELLNGASDWSQYSWGGCSLIYDRQIAERLCTASELKQTRNGERKPNSREEWLDVQTRALYQASRLVVDAIREVMTLAASATVE